MLQSSDLVRWLAIMLLLPLACSEPGGRATDASLKDSSMDAQADDGPVVDQSSKESSTPDIPPRQDSATGDDQRLVAPVFVETDDFGANPGNLTMLSYSPAHGGAQAALVVVLHGCKIGAEAFARGSGWDMLAAERGFHLLLPEQNANNNFTRCFNWFYSPDQVRGEGEPASIIAMVDAMLNAHDIDANRVFIGGMSAGGAMTAVMLAAYPDRFAGGVILAGVPYGCANSVLSAYSCMAGEDETPSTWAAAARAAYPGYSGTYPPLVIFQGSADSVVGAMNMNELMEQWTALHGIDQEADATRDLGLSKVAEYHDTQGPRVVTYLVDGMAHVVPVDPGSLPGQGGTDGGIFADVDLFSAGISADFWGI